MTQNITINYLAKQTASERREKYTESKCVNDPRYNNDNNNKNNQQRE